MMWAGRLDRGTPASDPRRDERVCGCDTEKPRNKITQRLIGHRARRQPAHAAAPRPNHLTRPLARTRARKRSRRPIRSATDRSRHRPTPNSAPPPPAPARPDGGWRYQAIRAIELAIDHGRITIPIRKARRELQGVLLCDKECALGLRLTSTTGLLLRLKGRDVGG
jgi:hypothetical protein